MNFNSRDIGVIVSMSLALILMTTVFTAVGAGGSFNQSNMPTFNMSSDQFSISSEFPERPGTPSRGRLEYNSPATQKIAPYQNSVWLEGDESGGAELIANPIASKNYLPRIQINVWNSGNATIVSDTVSSERKVRLSNGGWEILADFNNITQHTLNGTEYYDYSVDYRVLSRPDTNKGWLSSIPIVGGVVGTGKAIASMLGWFGSIAWWFLMGIFEISVAVMGTVFNIAVYIISFLTWQLQGYQSIVASVPPWASFIMAVPGILLTLELAKLGMVLVNLLPTT